MNKSALSAVLGLALLFGSLRAEVQNGNKAPEFSLRTATGEMVSLADYRGKFVVLEWTNPGCPFVQKFYDVGKMQEFQKEAKEMGAVWLTINSTSPKHKDHLSESQNVAYHKEKKMESPILIDASGEVARAYGAKRTPHCFVIDPNGVVIYQGAIDSGSRADPKEIASSTNFVLAALKEGKAGQEITKARTNPYGCTIKF